MKDRNAAHQRLIKRLRYLWMAELLFSFLLPAAWLLAARSRGQRLGPFAFGSLALVTWLLWQGAAYWWLKLQAARSESRIPERCLRWFVALRVVNWALIGLAPVLLILQARTTNVFRSTLDAVIGLGFYVLAVLEQVNYYHWQLMYDYPPDWRYLLENKRLKRSSLHRALEALDDEARAATEPER